MPTERRHQLFALAQASSTAGHFSKIKTIGLLRRVFTWPGMNGDVKSWCQQCPECQKSVCAMNQRAPLHPLHVITTPFSRIAFDLVGPLPRTIMGNKYILTCICLACKYPDAIPLKRVDVESVAESMLEVLSRTGIPKEILTDQGSVFTGKVMKQICSTLGIKHLKTSPYHPQTDGCLERWHGGLKTMLRKRKDKEQEWNRLLKYLIFTYRQAPHANSGYSPFELIFGRQLRRPLDVVRESWLSCDTSFQDVSEWVAKLRKQLRMMYDIASQKEVTGQMCNEKKNNMILKRDPDSLLKGLWH